MGLLIPSLKRSWFHHGLRVFAILLVASMFCSSARADKATLLQFKKMFIEISQDVIGKHKSKFDICALALERTHTSNGAYVGYKCKAPLKGNKKYHDRTTIKIQLHVFDPNGISSLKMQKDYKKDYNHFTGSEQQSKKWFAEKDRYGYVQQERREVKGQDSSVNARGLIKHRAVYKAALTKSYSNLAVKGWQENIAQTPQMWIRIHFQGDHLEKRQYQADALAVQIGSEILERLSKFKDKVTADQCETPSGSSDAKGLQPSTLALLKKPSLADDSSFKFDTGQVNLEVNEAYKMLSLPMYSDIEKAVAGGEITFLPTNPNNPNTHLTKDRNVRPNISIWKMGHQIHSNKRTDQKVAYSRFSLGKVGLFSLRTEIAIGAGAKYVQDEEKKYKKSEDSKFLDKKLRIEAAKKRTAYNKKHAARIARELQERLKKGLGFMAFMTASYTANTDLISVGNSTQARVTWDVESRHVSVRWRRGMHIVQMSVVAPKVKGAKKYGMSLANKIDGILDQHGFFEFPSKLTASECEPEEKTDERGEIVSSDILDANPIYSADKKTLPLKIPREFLISADTTRKGTTADGVSQLIMRAEVSGDTPVSFKLANKDDGKVEPLLGGKTVLDDKKYYAFALYTPPETFDVLKKGEVAPKSALKPPEKRLGEHLQVRDVKVLVQPKGGKAKSSTFILARPPVVLVHGLFSDPIQTWVKTYEHGSSMAALLERAGFLPFLVNYQKTNGAEAVGSWLADDTTAPPSGFKANYNVVWDSPLVDYQPLTLDYGYFKKEPIRAELQKPKATRIGGIKQALKYYREDMGLAATQAIVVGHSMGGILARVWASDHYNKAYKRPENFDQGDIDRILTLNSPHFGSELMELKDALKKGWIGGETWYEWGKRELVKTVLWWFFDPERGAVRDLRPGSEALKAIGKTIVPSYAIVTSATSAEIGAVKKDPLKLYNSLYTVAGHIFFNNRPLLGDFVEDRFKVWEKTPGKYRKNIIERSHYADAKKAQGSVLDLSIPQNREKYKRLINQNIEENIFYWAANGDEEYKRDLSNSIKNTIILPFGALDVRMGDYEKQDYRNLELLSNAQLADAGAKRTTVSKYINEKVAKEVPVTFMSILRDLIFHQDPNTDAVVRVESQIGGIKEGHHELVERVLHSYSPWDYTVQRRVISLLKWETASFTREGEGFPEAGGMTYRYMPSDSFVKPRVTGDLAIAWSGMVPSHAKEYQKIVENEDIFILARPVNSSSTQLLKNCHVLENNMDNCAAAKGMNVKGKSSSWGPQVGYIPFNQRYSKLWRTVRDPSLRDRQIDKYNKETLKSTQKEHPTKPKRFFAVTRALSMKTSNGMCAVLTDPKTGDAENEVVFKCDDGFHDWKNATKDGKSAFDPGQPLAAVLSVDEARTQRLIANPMYVLADDTSDLDLGNDKAGKPVRPYLTADYDLLAIGRRFQSGKCDIDSGVSGSSANCRPFELQEVKDAKFDSLSGVVSPWQNRLLDRINGAVERAGYRGGLVTHHGPENQYKASPYIDYPILVFDPGTNDKSDASSYLIRQGPPGFRDIHFKRFVTGKARLGFNIWPNPYSDGWQWEAWRKFDLKIGYDPRDVSNMPPYVEEAPKPESGSKAENDSAKNGADQNEELEADPVGKAEDDSEKEFASLDAAKPAPFDQEQKFWNGVKDLGDKDFIQLYLQKYPKGIYVKEAKLQIKSHLASGKPAVIKKRSLSALQCDELAASASDPENNTGFDVSKFELLDQKSEAISVCSKAMIKNLDDLQIRYQLARALGAVEFGATKEEKIKASEASLPILEQLAEKNYIAAMVDLAGIYHAALAVTPDNKKVERLYKVAAEQGNLIAITNLARFYLDAQTGKPEINKAINLLRRGSKFGDPFSYYFVGYVDKPGKGLPDYNKLVIKYTKDSASKNNIVAIFSMAQKYETGNGVSQNIDNALRLYAKAIELGYSDGKADLERLQAKQASRIALAKVNPKEPKLEGEARGSESAGEVWIAVQNSTSVAVLGAFIEQFPKSIYAKFAKARIEELKPGTTAGGGGGGAPVKNNISEKPAKNFGRECDRIVGYPNPPVKGQYWLLNTPKPKFEPAEVVEICRKAVADYPDVARHKTESWSSFVSK